MPRCWWSWAACVTSVAKPSSPSSDSGSRSSPARSAPYSGGICRWWTPRRSDQPSVPQAVFPPAGTSASSGAGPGVSAAAGGSIRRSRRRGRSSGGRRAAKGAQLRTAARCGSAVRSGKYPGHAGQRPVFPRPARFHHQNHAPRV